MPSPASSAGRQTSSAPPAGRQSSPARHAGRAAVVAAVVLALLLAGSPSQAQVVTVREREPVFDGLVHERITIRLGGGLIARGDVVRMDLETDHLELRPMQARDRIAGLETVPSMARRAQSDGAIAGVNGGWHFYRTGPPAGPRGAPNGFSVLDGRVQGAQALLRGGNTRPRSALGITDGGGLFHDLLDPDVTVELGDRARGSKELNRLVHPDANDGNRGPARGLMVLDSQLGEQLGFGTEVHAAELDDLPLSPGTRATGVVTSRREGVDRLPAAGTTAVATYGDRLGQLAGVDAGDEVAVTVAPNPLGSTSGWSDVRHAVPAIGILRDGVRRSNEEMANEGFSRHDLVEARHPRTAIGYNDDEILLVTVDGRQPSHSVGLTLRELAGVLRELGADHGVALDGGGSTTMTIDAAVANRVSDPSPRSVADALFVHTDYPFSASRRLAGADRYATAAEAARVGFTNADTAVLATGEAFPDALAGGALAAGLGHPLLLTRGESLPDATAAALRDLGVSRVVVLGGPNAVDSAVVDELEGRGITVDRRSGADRYETATAAAALTPTDSPDGARRAFVAAGRAFPDALTAASPAGQLAAPVLLTEADALPSATRRWLAGADLDEVVVVGGPAAVSQSVEAEIAAASDAQVTRLAGPERFATAAQVNRWASDQLADLDATGVVVAQGRAFPDALAGGPLAAARDQLLMIVPPRNLDDEAAARSYLDERASALDEVVLLGGTAALSSYQHWQLDQLALP